MNQEVCRISFTQKLPANENTFQIAINGILQSTKNHKNLLLVNELDEVYDKLYQIMEKYDSLDAFAIYCESPKEIFNFLDFLRQQNPKKAINVFCFGEKIEFSEDEEFLEIVSSLNFIEV